MPKVFKKILDARIRGWSERVGTLSDLQGGFREGRGTLDQVYILNEIIASRKECGDPTFTAFIDVAKAYDTVWRPGLWAKLKAAGLDPETLDIIQIMYNKVVRRVLVSGRASDPVQIELGVPQGAVLSPWLYASYVDGLHAALRDRGLGVWIHGRLVPILLYADDIVLMASTPEMLQASLDVLHTFSRRWRFSANLGKSNAVVFGPRGVVPYFNRTRVFWQLGETLRHADSYKYLGLELLSCAGRGKWNKYLSRVVTKASGCLSLLVYQGGGSTGARPRTMAGQWKSLCRPVLEYGCELWHGEISAQWSNRLESIQNKFGCLVWGSRTTPPLLQSVLILVFALSVAGGLCSNWVSGTSSVPLTRTDFWRMCFVGDFGWSRVVVAGTVS